jgi:hypothetical protein
MSITADDGAYELDVAPELAAVAERLGVPLHVGNRVQFEVSEGGLADGGTPTRHEPLPPAWVDSIVTDDEQLAAHAREVMRAEFGEQ